MKSCGFVHSGSQVSDPIAHSNISGNWGAKGFLHCTVWTVAPDCAKNPRIRGQLAIDRDDYMEVLHISMVILFSISTGTTHATTEVAIAKLAGAASLVTFDWQAAGASTCVEFVYRPS